MEYLTCRVSGDRYGLPLERVREIVGAVPITRVPGAPPALRGLVGHRGNPLPVLDLAVRLGFSETVVGRRSCLVLVEAPCQGAPITVGVLVDGVDRIASVDRGQGALPPSLQSLAIEGLCTGFGELDGQLVPLLDPEALLRLEALRRARPRAAASRPAARVGRASRPAPTPAALVAAELAAQDASPRTRRPSAPEAAPAGRGAGRPRGDVPTGGLPPEGGRPLAAGAEGRRTCEEAARRVAETPRVRVGVAAPGLAPRPSAFPEPGNRPRAAPLAPAASPEAPLAIAGAATPPAWVSNARRAAGVLAAAVAVALAVAGAFAVLGWRDLGGRPAAPPPGPLAAPTPAAARPPDAAMASPAAALPRPEAGAVAARERAAAAEPRPLEARRPAPPPPARQPARDDDRIHEVRPGDCLWRLSRRYLHDPERWPAIYERNRAQIADPNLIQPHQRLVIPAEAPPAQGG